MIPTGTGHAACGQYFGPICKINGVFRFGSLGIRAVIQLRSPQKVDEQVKLAQPLLLR